MSRMPEEYHLTEEDPCVADMHVTWTGWQERVDKARRALTTLWAIIFQFSKEHMQ